MTYNAFGGTLNLTQPPVCHTHDSRLNAMPFVLYARAMSDMRALSAVAELLIKLRYCVLG